MPRARTLEDRQQAHQAVYAAFVARMASQHLGRARGIRCCDLAQSIGLPERTIRHLVSEAREQGIAITGTPETGYFVAETSEELEQTCQFLRNRAMHSLRLLSRLTKTPLQELMGQMRINA
jgi:hypothetical protein